MNSLAKRAKLNEGHVKVARAYKARVASLTSERAELRAGMQNMTEEAVKLKSDRGILRWRERVPRVEKRRPEMA